MSWIEFAVEMLLFFFLINRYKQDFKAIRLLFLKR